MGFKYIIESVIVLVIALIIFGYFFNPMVKYQTKEFITDVQKKFKNEINSKLEAIPTPEKVECKKKAEELIPELYLFSSKPKTQVNNYWNDGSEIKDLSKDSDVAFWVGLANCFRAGTNEGENINYLYPISEDEKNAIGSLKKYCQSSFSYSEKIIADDGTVLGYNSFTVTPSILKLADNQIKTTEGDYDGETDTYTFGWEGFDGEMKRLYDSDQLKFRITLEKLSGSSTICENESSEEKGEFTCEGIGQAGWEGTFGTCLWCSKFLIEPDIYDNKIYEIVDYNVTSCTWIK